MTISDLNLTKNFAAGNVIQSTPHNTNYTNIETTVNAILDVSNTDTDGNTVIISATNKNIEIDPAGTGIIEIYADIIPDTGNSYDLGSSSAKFKDAYIDGTLYADNTQIDNINIDGNTISSSSGDVTITPSGNVNISANSLKMAGNVVIDTSRNITVGTITATGKIDTSNSTVECGDNTTATMSLKGGSGGSSNVYMYNGGNLSSLLRHTPSAGYAEFMNYVNYPTSLPVFRLYDNGTAYITSGNSNDIALCPSGNVNISANSLEMSGSVVIDSSRNITAANVNCNKAKGAFQYSYNGTAKTDVSSNIALNEGYVIINTYYNNVTATLPSIDSVNIGHRIFIYNWSSSNTTKIVRNDSDTIESLDSTTTGTDVELSNAYDWVELMLVWTTKWKIINGSGYILT